MTHYNIPESVYSRKDKDAADPKENLQICMKLVTIPADKMNDLRWYLLHDLAAELLATSDMVEKIAEGEVEGFQTVTLGTGALFSYEEAAAVARSFRDIYYMSPTIH